MTVIHGRVANPAVAEGKLHIVETSSGDVARRSVNDTEAELKRYCSARDSAATELDALREKAVADVGEDGAMIFEIHRMMLYDEDFDDAVREMIQDEAVNAEYAVTECAAKISAMFAGMSSDYMKSRSGDVRDAAERVVALLEGRRRDFTLTSPAIIAAENLSPADTVQLDKKYVLGFVTEGGSENSHTAILARTMDIPAVVGVGKIPREYEGCDAILDGHGGSLIISPDPETRKNYEDIAGRDRDNKNRLEAYRGKCGMTKCGRRVRIYANIGDTSDIALALSGDAEGIGLFRSEFLYMKYGRAPTEDEQFEAYRDAAEKMNGGDVIVRTLDAGADKKLPFLGLGNEANPALGFRAIRISLSDMSLFKTQLRALYRASAYGNISIMLPMIVSVDEVKRAKEIAAEVRTELARDKIPVGQKVPFGIMIETPAAAVTADLLARESDFFSIGTNDLTQYTMAADRENPRVAYLGKTMSEALKRLIAYVSREGEKARIWTGVCGEAAADVSLTQFFVDCGITELSVSPSRIIEVRRAVAETTVAQNNDKT